MPDHYYTPLPGSDHARREVRVSIDDLSLSFMSDSGVFSKNELDDGSRLLIQSVPPLCGRVLDLGCGWGVIGVCLKRLNPDINLVMSDVNERAVALAKENAVRNGVQALTILSNGFSSLDGTFDFVITNPPIRAGKAVIYSLFDGALDRINAGGALYVVIRKQQGAPSALKHIQEKCPSACVIARDKGFWILEARKT